MQKRVLYLILLVIISIFSRWLYSDVQTQPILNADSYGYYGFAKQILEKPSIPVFVNQYRVPVYPTILAGLMVANGSKDFPLDSQAFRPTLDQLIFIQSALSVAGIVLVYLLLLQLSVPLAWAFGISMFLSLNVYSYPLERAVMTDSLAGSFLIGLMYLLIRLVQKPTNRDYAFFGILSAVCWLLRPNLLLVPLLSLPLLLFVKTNRKFFRANVVIFGVTLLLPIVFVSLNSQYHGYTGISQINEINLLGRILEFDLPVEAGKQYKTYYEAVRDNKQRYQLTMPYRFIDTYAPLTYVEISKMNELQKFDRAVIAANIPSYILHTITYIPKIFSDEPPLLAIDTKASSGLAGFFSFIWKFYKMIWHVGYLVFFFLPVSLWLYFRKPSVSRMITVLLGAISVSQLLVIVFFDYYDAGQYARLASVIQPQAILFLVVTWENYKRSVNI